MKLLLVIALTPLVLLAVKVGIRSIEEELLRKPTRYDDTD
jgi:hypothetical protein